MTDKGKKYWEGALEKYAKKDWVDKPSIFVGEVAQYFPPGGEMIELAAGCGQDSIWLASQGFRVLCTDRSESGTREAKSRAEAVGVSMQFDQVDLAKKIPYKNGSFDVVHSHLGLHYFNRSKTRELFSEILRILKAGGILTALFNSVKDGELATGRLIQVDEGYYLDEQAQIYKSYFSPEDVAKLTAGLFEPVICDLNGRAYKDGDTPLVRFVGRAIK